MLACARWCYPGLVGVAGAVFGMVSPLNPEEFNNQEDGTSVCTVLTLFQVKSGEHAKRKNGAVVLETSKKYETNRSVVISVRIEKRMSL